MSNPWEQQQREIFYQLVNTFHSDVCRRNQKNLPAEVTFTRSAKPYLLDDPLVAFLKCFGGWRGLSGKKGHDWMDKQMAEWFEYSNIIAEIR